MRLVAFAALALACVRSAPDRSQLLGEHCRGDLDCGAGLCVIGRGRASGTCELPCRTWNSSGGDCPAGFYCSPEIDSPMICHPIGDGGVPPWLPPPQTKDGPSTGNVLGPP